MFNDNESLNSSPFGISGHRSFTHPTERSRDVMGRDVFSRTNVTGLTTRETRDHTGSVIDQRDSFFNW